MLKRIITFLSVSFVFFGNAQVKKSYVEDITNTFTKETIDKASFNEFQNPVNNGFNNGVYWVKIEGFKKKSVLQIPNNHISVGIAYQNKATLYPEKNERFLTFIVEQSPVFIKLNITKEAYIPITVQEYSAYTYADKKSNLFIGFYYGFAFVVLLINLFYFINFGENTFLYYALFLLGVTVSLFISDGIFRLLNFSKNTLDILTLIIHITASYVGALFATSYLQTNNYYPKLNYVTTVLMLAQTFLFVMYVMTTSFIFYALIETLAFALLGIYWITSLFLYSKNIFTKIFAVAYVFIFLLGVDFYVLKLFGFELLQISRNYIKTAGFFEMILLSFAVIYRMRILHEENIQMRNDITQYATQIASLSDELQKNKEGTINYFTEFDLSEREQEIFTFLSQGNSNKEIAQKLFISVNTVKYHIKKIYSKLNIKNREEAKQISVY